MLMTTLIKVTGGILSISDEALLIKPLRMIFNRDRTKDKEEYMQAASYLYFMYDPRSDYMYITDDVERDRVIIETEGLIKVKKDALLKDDITLVLIFLSINIGPFKELLILFNISIHIL